MINNEAKEYFYSLARFTHKSLKLYENHLEKGKIKEALNLNLPHVEVKLPIIYMLSHSQVYLARHIVCLLSTLL